jgi:hypothetical protein
VSVQPDLRQHDARRRRMRDHDSPPVSCRPKTSAIALIVS